MSSGFKSGARRSRGLDFMVQACWHYGCKEVLITSSVHRGAVEITNFVPAS